MTLETSELIFLRSIELGAQRPPIAVIETDWFESMVRTSWHHASPRSTPPPIEIPFPRPVGRDLLLIVEEGDNQPLPISGTRLLLPGWQLRFFRPAGPLRLLYGRTDLSEPRYDVAMLTPSAMKRGRPRDYRAAGARGQYARGRAAVAAGLLDRPVGGGRLAARAHRPPAFAGRAAIFATCSMTRSRLPLQILPICASL